MIVRRYGRRNRSITRGYSDDDAMVSQESSQDVFDFTFSSQESKEFPILPSGKSEENERLEGSSEGYLWKSKKAKVGSDDSEGFGFNSSQESGELASFQWRKGKENENSKGSERSLSKPDIIKIDDDDDTSDPYGYKSLLESSEFEEKPEKGKMKKNGVLAKKKSKKKNKKEIEEFTRPVAPTVTLMETQEFGEMMERMDEVNFALDGLKKGQPLRIRRASLLSLLSICATAHQRRLLRAHGLAKTVIDSILGISFDDSPSNLAAAALFFTFTSDGQDDELLDSPSCIKFLIKLLKPLVSGTTKVKSTTIGSKLLALRLDPNLLQDTSKGVDSTIDEIMHKVEEILISCKEIKQSNGEKTGNEKPELNPKWISLLTLEKACISTISIEDTSGIVRKSGGDFKEKLRELGGLDAVFELSRKCHTVMENWSEQSLSSVMNLNDKTNLESLVLLLKCLKLMENATFLSKDNQSHLLEMKGNFENHPAPRSFVKLILSAIKILSDVSQQSSFNNSDNEKSSIQCSENKDDYIEILSLCSSQGSQRLTSSQPDSSKLSFETITTSSDSRSLKTRAGSSKSESFEGSNNEMSISENGSNKDKVMNESSSFDFMEESEEDPFAFEEEDEVKPTKWDLLSGKKIKITPSLESIKEIPRIIEIEDNSESVEMLTSQKEASCSSPPLEDNNNNKVSNLLTECLLTAVKVLMNLTNDNPLGCEQIAEGGGLETLSLLIANHFPSFNINLPLSDNNNNNNASSSKLSNLNEKHLTDQELDFLVAILGLLVNLVEKDERNRSRLATASVPLNSLEGLEKGKGQNRDVIPLLCSIFLANEGAGEVAEEGRNLTWDDEEAITQGEKEAEKMIIEAYSALLLAFLSTESKKTRKSIAEYLPNHKLSILVPVLERFVEFHMTLNMISPETHTTVLEVIESCRIP